MTRNSMKIAQGASSVILDRINMKDKDDGELLYTIKVNIEEVPHPLHSVDIREGNTDLPRGEEEVGEHPVDSPAVAGPIRQAPGHRQGDGHCSQCIAK